jgi:secondary thiamine-phosphate synthase enzyme
MVATEHLQVHTRGQGDVRDLTTELQRAVSASHISAGLVAAFVVGSTASLTTVEFEPGVVADLAAAFERIAPRRAEYQHHLRWGDDNGSSHVRAGMVGPSITVPIVDGRLTLGTWQQVVLVEFDTRGRDREVVIQIVGDGIAGAGG